MDHFLLGCTTAVTDAERLTCSGAGYVRDQRSVGIQALPTDQSDQSEHRSWQSLWGGRASLQSNRPLKMSLNTFIRGISLCELLQPSAAEWNTEEFSSLDFKMSKLIIATNHFELYFIFSFNYSKVRLDPESKIAVWIKEVKLALVV